MSKHIADQPRPHGGIRMREFARQERMAATHPAIETLRKSPKTRTEQGRKIAEYLRIDRGRET